MAVILLARSAKSEPMPCAALVRLEIACQDGPLAANKEAISQVQHTGLRVSLKGDRAAWELLERRQRNATKGGEGRGQAG
jgi:hypothetical protein